MHSTMVIADKTAGRPLRDLHTVLHFPCQSSFTCAASTTLFRLPFAPGTQPRLLFPPLVKVRVLAKWYNSVHKTRDLFFLWYGGNKQTRLSVKRAFLVGEEVNLAVAGLCFSQQKMEHVQRKRKSRSTTHIGRNRRKIIILSASDPWKYSFRAKKNHETDLEKTWGFSEVIHLGSFCLTSGFWASWFIF